MSAGSTRGFSRDRTRAFASIRQRHHAHSHAFEERDSARLLGSETGNGLSGVDAVSASVLPTWVDVQQQVNSDMAVIKDKMGELSRIHKKATLPTFDDASDNSEQMVDIITREITQMFRKAQQRLKSLQLGVRSGDETNANVVKNVQQSLAAELQKLSQDFRKQQKGYLQTLRKQQEVISESPGFGGSPGGGSLMDDGEYDPGFTESQILKSREQETLVAERDKDIQKILKSVEELATIMRDLSVLVIDQGSVVDRIDYNMEQVSTHVEQGVKELTKAEKHQKSSRMMLCILFLLCACILMAFIVLFKKLL